MPLSPLDRKIELLRKGVTMSGIARELDPPVSPNHVHKVVAGERRSPRIEQAIADVIGLPVAEVFPDREHVAAVA
jgi:lambda repressor-like predicted transcriptional regulator